MLKVSQKAIAAVKFHKITYKFCLQRAICITLMDLKFHPIFTIKTLPLSPIISLNRISLDILV